MPALHGTAPHPAVPQLVIERGQQQGARIDLTPGRHGVGSAVSNSIALLDPALAATHFVLEVTGTAFTLHAEAGLQRLDGKRRVRPGPWRRHRLPARHALRGRRHRLPPARPGSRPRAGRAAPRPPLARHRGGRAGRRRACRHLRLRHRPRRH